MFIGKISIKVLSFIILMIIINKKQTILMLRSGGTGPMKLRQPRFRRKVPNPAGEKNLKDKSGSLSQEGYSYFDKSSFFYG